MHLTREPISSCHPDSFAPCHSERSEESPSKDPSVVPSGLPQDDMGFSSGAEVVFIGKVRDHSAGRKVLFLEYEAYEAMAENSIENLIGEAKSHWKVGAVSVLHRLGKVALGEIAVLIKVESAHRDEAYQASRFLIEEIKHKVPVWKKEYFADGTTEWSLCKHGYPVPVS